MSAHRAHALLSARIGDDAEGAELVAALDDGDVGLERVPPPRDAQRKRDVLDRVEIDGGPAPGASLDGLVDEHRQPLQILRADDYIDRRRALQDLPALLLRHAPGHGDDRPLAALDGHLPELAQAGEEHFLGPLADAAGVQHHDIGIPVVVCRFVASLLEQSGHALRVMEVHLAAVRLDEVLYANFRFRLSFFIRLSPASLPAALSTSAFRERSPAPRRTCRSRQSCGPLPVPGRRRPGARPW